MTIGAPDAIEPPVPATPGSVYEVGRDLPERATAIFRVENENLRADTLPAGSTNRGADAERLGRTERAGSTNNAPMNTPAAPLTGSAGDRVLTSAPARPDDAPGDHGSEPALSAEPADGAGWS